ncbi:MAG: glycogen debranching enzyme GlgX, partial [Pseudomonadota bacterium]
MIEAGICTDPGPVVTKDGVSFGVYASNADRVELCLFDEADKETVRHELLAGDSGLWHGFLPGCGEGQRYGFRAHGPWSPADGLRFNPAKLLIDPYARLLSGTVDWSPAIYDHVVPAADDDALAISNLDSASSVPKSVVAADRPSATAG